MTNNRQKNRGFSLVEIVIAMTILSLISGTVMAILAQAGDAAADIRDTDQKDEEISRFLDLLERTVESLPVDASIEMIPESESISGFAEMKISNAVGAFTFGEDVGSAGELTIGLQLQQDSENGQMFELAISRDSFSPEDTNGDGMVFGAGDEEFMTADSEGRYWLPLVSNIMSANWRYWDEEEQNWLTEWQEENLPALMEFTVEDSHRPGPVRVVFEMPQHLVTGEGIEPDTSDSDNTASTVSTPPPTTRPGGRGGPGAGKGKGKGGFKGGKGPGKGGKGPGKGGKGDGGKGGRGKGGGKGPGGGDGGRGNGGGGANPPGAGQQ